MKVHVNKFEKLQGDMSETEFAKILGVNRTQIWRLKTGKSNPGAKFIGALKTAFPEINLDDYFFYD